MALVPQVVDVVAPVPVVAAGGIFDGRGIAAAFMLGAVGVNIGTRFLASKEAPIENAWKVAITSAESEDAVKVEVLNDIQPLPGTAGYGTVLRSLRTPFLDEWGAKREEARREGQRLWAEIQARAWAGSASRDAAYRGSDLWRYQRNLTRRGDHTATGRRGGNGIVPMVDFRCALSVIACVRWLPYNMTIRKAVGWLVRLPMAVVQ